MSEQLVAPYERPSGTFRSLGTRNYRLWFLGQSTSLIGFWVQNIAQALLVLELTSSGTVLGAVAALQFLPILVVGPWAGVLSDRVDKRHILLVTQTAMMATAFILGVLVLTDLVTLPAVVILALVTGIAYGFDQPARRTIVTELVSDADEANAVALNSALNNLAKVVGPAVAAGLVATVGLGACFVVNALSTVAVLFALLRMDPSKIRRPEKVVKQKGQIREGFEYVWHDRQLRLPLMIVGIMCLLPFNTNVLFPLLVTRDLDATAGSYAIVMVVMSVGGLCGSLWTARRPNLDGLGLLAWGCCVFGVLQFTVALAPNIAALCVSSFATGAATMIVFNFISLRLQLGAERVMRGRVMAVFSMVMLGSAGLGGPLAGWVADALGTRAAFGVAAAVSIVLGGTLMASLRSALPARQSETTDPRGDRSPAVTAASSISVTSS